MILKSMPEIGDSVYWRPREPGAPVHRGRISGFFPISTRPAHADVCPMCQCPSPSLFAAGWPMVDDEVGNKGMHIDPRRLIWDGGEWIIETALPELLDAVEQAEQLAWINNDHCEEWMGEAKKREGELERVRDVLRRVLDFPICGEFTNPSVSAALGMDLRAEAEAVLRGKP